MFRVILRLAKIASAVDAASSQLLSGAHKTYRRNFGVGQSRVSFERNGIFAVLFKVDLPDAIGYSARDGAARRFNPGNALSTRRTDFKYPCDARHQAGQSRLAPFPRRIYFNIAAGPQSAEAAFRPCRRKRRQKGDHSRVALQAASLRCRKLRRSWRRSERTGGWRSADSRTKLRGCSG